MNCAGSSLIFSLYKCLSLTWTSGAPVKVLYVVSVCLSILFVFISYMGFFKLFSFSDLFRKFILSLSLTLYFSSLPKHYLYGLRF